MAKGERGLAVGVFETRTQARHAVEALKRAGFPAQRIVLTASGGVSGRAGEGVAAGGLSGAIAGGVLGGLVGFMGAGLGPLVAAGLAMGALAGATLGGLVGGLLQLGTAEPTTGPRGPASHAIRAIVTVEAGDRHDQATAILRRYGGRSTEEAADEALGEYARRRTPGVGPSGEYEGEDT